MLSHVQLFANSWTIACQGPLSVEFSRQEYWSGLLFPSPRGLPDPGSNLCLCVSCISCIGRQILLPLSHLGSPLSHSKLLYTLNFHLLYFLVSIFFDRNLSYKRARRFLCSVHWYLPSRWKSSWNTPGAQTFFKLMHSRVNNKCFETEIRAMWLELRNVDKWNITWSRDEEIDHAELCRPQEKSLVFFFLRV